MSYGAYRQLAIDLIKVGQTTGANHSPAMLDYSRLNNIRMDRLDRAVRLEEDVVDGLKAIERPLIWLVLVEAWCGDVAQILPVLNAMAATNDHLQLRLLLRDEHPEVMDAFLTNGTRSIPKLIILDGETLQVLGSWGARPAAAQAIMDGAKARMAREEDRTRQRDIFDQAKVDIQKWYNQDKTRSTQREVLAAVQVAATLLAGGASREAGSVARL